MCSGALNVSGYIMIDFGTGSAIAERRCAEQSDPVSRNLTKEKGNGDPFASSIWFETESGPYCVSRAQPSNFFPPRNVMPHLSLSSCIVLATLSAIFIIISFTLTSPRFHVNFLEVTRYFQHTSSRANTLGVASKIIVINLPRRTDRKIRMTAIQKALNLTFDWADATDASEEVVDRIMERVRKERGNEIDDLTRSSHSEWSLDANITRWNNSATPLGLWGADLWTLPPTDPRSSDMTDPLLPIVQPDIRPAIPCQQNMSSYNPSEPKAWQILSPAMVACWHSHLTVLRRVAEGIDEVTIIFEDDVDVEWDLENRLVGMWDALPKEWDIVALGQSITWKSLSFLILVLLPRTLLVGGDNVPSSPGSSASAPVALPEMQSRLRGLSRGCCSSRPTPSNALVCLRSSIRSSYRLSDSNWTDNRVQRTPQCGRADKRYCFRHHAWEREYLERNPGR
jgi:GR25 family glycosyltransferase involved in LPS biosynthesis